MRASLLLAIGMALVPWLGCGTNGRDYSTAASAGEAGEAGEDDGGAAGAAPDPGGCALTLCGGVCTDTKQDPEHCGTCDQSCTALPHLGTTLGVSCANGVCAVPPSACLDGYAHCSPDPADGCETDITSAEHCGACDVSCGDDAPFCALGSCSKSCPTEAPNECGKVCANFANDAMHCGDCATVCASPNGGGNAICMDGTCGVACLGGFHQCPGTTECAADNDATRCGPTCSACAAPAGGHASCVDNACAVACDGATTQCGDACVDTQSDVKNCGACGHDCTGLPHIGSVADVSCSAGKCVVPPSACATGFAHCSAVADDGCETDITKPEHCGACATKCPANNPLCAPQGCRNACPANAPTLCDGTTCVDLDTDAKHCGDCATPCTQPASGGNTTCVAKKCVLKCLTGYHACGTSECAADGDASKCGATCTQCPTTNNGTAQCTNNTCSIKCKTGYHNCGDGTCASDADATRCEASCKACAGTTNGSPQCSNNACTVACDSKYHKCSDGKCYSDSSATKCTSDCITCSTPNGTSECVGNACVTTACKTGFKLCGGKCVDPSVDPSCGGWPLVTGNDAACAIKSGGVVWCWTTTTAPVQVASLTSVIQLSLYEEAVALKSDGTIWSWSTVGAALPPTDVSAGMKFKQVAVGVDASCRYGGVATNDNVYCWNGTSWIKKGTMTATHVSIEWGSPFQAYARATDGKVWSWAPNAAPAAGAGTFSQVAAGINFNGENVVRRTLAGVLSENGTNLPVGVFGAATFVQTTVGMLGGCGLASDGKVGCWGYGPYGQLGNSMNPTSDDMVQFGGSAFRATVVSRGPFWTCALKTDATVWCVGKGFAENGTPKQVNITVP